MSVHGVFSFLPKKSPKKLRVDGFLQDCDKSACLPQVLTLVSKVHPYRGKSFQRFLNHSQVLCLSNMGKGEKRTENLNVPGSSYTVPIRHGLDPHLSSDIPFGKPVASLPISRGCWPGVKSQLLPVASPSTEAAKSSIFSLYLVVSFGAVSNPNASVQPAAAIIRT